jgi:hypothetical protein
VGWWENILELFVLSVTGRVGSGVMGEYTFKDGVSQNVERRIGMLILPQNNLKTCTQFSIHSIPIDVPTPQHFLLLYPSRPVISEN